MRRISDERVKSIIWGIIFSVIPIIAFYLMESYEHNPFEEVRSKAQCFNVILFEFIAWIMYLILGNAKWALRIVLAVSMIFGLVNHYVMLFRTTPFVPWDIFSINTAASVVSNYDFTPSTRVVVVSILFVVLIVLMHFINHKMKMSFYLRMIPFAVVTICLCVFVNMLQDDDFQTENYLYPFLFTPGYMTQVNGMAVTFAMDLEYLAIDKPSGYNADEAKEELAEYADAETVTSQKLPNIIVIMDEAFADLKVLDEFYTNVDYMPFVHSMQNGKENTVSGYLNVSVCGGNTANTEFEFLTGNTMAFLPTGSIPYQQYIKQDIPSLASYLSGLGYQTYAQHPYLASGWNRDKVYEWMGFDNMTFIDGYSSRKLIRNYISDESSFEQIKRTFEEKEDGKPAFIFNVTMQNHGGYSDTYSDFVNSVRTIDHKSNDLDQYLTLLSISDSEVEKLIAYFSGVDEDTVVVFFGDHQPNDFVTSPIARTTENDYNRYQVPYFIWANYDIDEAVNVNTSANYLAANVLKAAGVPTDEYQNFLLQLEKEFPIISAVRTKSTEDADEQLLEKYKKLQYYMLFDWEEDN
ncbi:MAG: LTA synthase family protein [Agathobacter sp.]|nr:LTA synthase family protein [Agathobacter sp.]